MIEIIPITFKEAKDFVNEHHRHNVAPQGQKFSIGIKEDDTLIGVVTVGRPIARRNDDGKTAEITRCCVLEGHKNANSLLYAAAWRALWVIDGSSPTPYRRNQAPAYGPPASNRSERPKARRTGGPSQVDRAKCRKNIRLDRRSSGK